MKRKKPRWSRCTRSCLILMVKMLRLTLISKLEHQEKKVLKRRESYSNCLRNRFQRQLKTSELYVLVTKDFIIKETSSTESSKVSWPKVEISLSKMVPEAKAYTERSSRTNRFGIHILTKVCSQWPMLVPIQMVHSSSYALDQRLT